MRLTVQCLVGLIKHLLNKGKDSLWRRKGYAVQVLTPPSHPEAVGVIDLQTRKLLAEMTSHRFHAVGMLNQSEYLRFIMNSC